MLSTRRHAGPNATTDYIVSIIFTVILDASSLKETGKNWKATCRTSQAGHGHPVLIPAAKFLVNLLDVDRLPELHWADVQMARMSKWACFSSKALTQTGEVA